MCFCLHAFIHSHIHAFFLTRKQNSYPINISTATTTTRHRYFTRANKSKLVANFETGNADVKETMAHVQGEMNFFQGNMETIMEYLQTQSLHVLEYRIGRCVRKHMNPNQYQASQFAYPRATSILMLSYAPANPVLQYV